MPYRYSSCSCWGNAVQKSPRHRRFKSDRDEIWHECSSTDRVTFLIWRHTVILSRWQPWRQPPLAPASAGCPLDSEHVTDSL